MAYRKPSAGSLNAKPHPGYLSRKPSQGDIHLHHRQMPATRPGQPARIMTAEQAMRLAPPMSEAGQRAFNQKMGNITRDAGGFTGCGYIDYAQGIMCPNGSIAQYHPNTESFYSDWTANVQYPYGPHFPQPNVVADGTVEQILLSGGGGYNPCTEDCSCQNNPQCPCMNSDPNVQCGWPSVGGDCMEAVPNGKYPSLAACELANSLGYYASN